MAGMVFGLPDHVAVVVVAMVSVVAGLGVVSAESAPAPAMALSDSAFPVAEDAACFRPLLDVIWGFLVTLLACSVTFWGRYKHSLLGNRVKIRAAFYAVFLPVCGLHEYIWASYENAMLIWKYQQTKQTLQCPGQHLSRRNQLRELCFLLSPFSKFPGRILFWCDVVVYMEKESSLLAVDWLWVENSFVKVESEAMVIGEVAAGKTKDGDYERKELSSAGCLVLMLAEGLPDYDELKFLRGYSGFAMIVIAFQALGYITAVLFREVKHLPVAPLEVVGLILNIILLMEVGVYSFFNPCHRPLVIYTNSKREEQLLETLASMTKPKIPLNRFAKVFTLVAIAADLCLCGVVVYFIITLIKVSNTFVVLPLIFFVIAIIILIIDFIKRVHFEYGESWKLTIHWLIIPSFVIIYTLALGVTIVYWKSQQFHVRAKLFNISDLIPFIG